MSVDWFSRLRQKLSDQLEKIGCTNASSVTIIETNVVEYQPQTPAAALEKIQTLEIREKETVQPITPKDGSVDQVKMEPSPPINEQPEKSILTQAVPIILNVGKQSMITAAMQKRSLRKEELSYETIEGWSRSFDRMMFDHKGRHKFNEFLAGKQSARDFDFWKDVQNYKSLNNNVDWQPRALEIFTKYFSAVDFAGSYITTEMIDSIKKSISHPDAMIFEDAANQVFSHLFQNEYPAFLNSNVYIMFLEDYIPLLAIRGWSSCYRTLMKYNKGRQIFREFCEKERCSELLCFIEDATKYCFTTDQNARQVKALEIVNNYISGVFSLFNVIQIHFVYKIYFQVRPNVKSV